MDRARCRLPGEIGRIASGPASPTTAAVGRVTIPPSANPIHEPASSRAPAIWSPIIPDRSPIASAIRPGRSANHATTWSIYDLIPDRTLPTPDANADTAAVAAASADDTDTCMSAKDRKSALEE